MNKKGGVAEDSLTTRSKIMELLEQQGPLTTVDLMYRADGKLQFLGATVELASLVREGKVAISGSGSDVRFRIKKGGVKRE